jgi:hypothetical protein
LQPILPRRLPRTVRWLLPAVLLAVAPKCLLCVLAYAGLGAALGLGGAEICGGATGSPDAWASTLAWFGVALGLAWGVFASGRWFRRKSGGCTHTNGRGSTAQPPFTV